MEIGETGDLNKLIISGSPSQSQLANAWEEIIKRNGKSNNDYNYQNYKELVLSYDQLYAEFVYVKAALTKLYLVVDRELIKELQDLGYQISTTSSEAYEKSLNACSSRSNNLITQVISKRNEVEQASEERKSDSPTFEELMANICLLTGLNLDDNLTLARYNEYKKLVKKKYEKKARPQYSDV